MRIIIQKVSSASVVVEGETIGSSSNAGILALVGFGQEDDESKISVAIEKIINMRIFPNEKGKFDFSLLDIEGDLTLVPQFTLYADTSKGRRPEFFSAMKPSSASIIFDKLVNCAREKLSPSRVQTGKFGADMKVSLVNDGPVTISIEL